MKALLWIIPPLDVPKQMWCFYQCWELPTSLFLQRVLHWGAIHNLHIYQRVQHRALVKFEWIPSSKVIPLCQAETFISKAKRHCANIFCVPQIEGFLSRTDFHASRYYACWWVFLSFTSLKWTSMWWKFQEDILPNLMTKNLNLWADSVVRADPHFPSMLYTTRAPSVSWALLCLVRSSHRIALANRIRWFFVECTSAKEILPRCVFIRVSFYCV